jgi:hypothetical protein
LTITRDYGVRTLATSTERDPAESETVMRLLDRRAGIKTRYGGAFVTSIDGLEGNSAARRRRDWFFYVNGIESSEGAASVRVRGGDRIWWDYRDWTDAMRVPAVVGSWPQPFLRGHPLVDVDCAGARKQCDEVATALRGAGARAAVRSPGEGEGRGDGGPRMLVGPWAALRRDSTARLLEAGPGRSGVFGDYESGRFVALDQRGRATRRLSPDAGLVAALRDGDGPATWVVTGAGAAGVTAATRLLDARTLRNRYALATDGGAIPLPVR